MLPFFVYMLRCSDGKYYVGHTDEIEKRISEHKNGLTGYTASRLPITVVFVQEFGTRDEAICAERQIKGWTRAKKEALIKGDWARIVELSKNRTDK